MENPGPQACYRHPDQPSGIRCQRCGRPICPQCMNPAAVGFQCPECVAQGMRETRQGQGPYGGQRSANPMMTTFVLIGINVAVWLAIVATGGSFGRLFNLLALSPAGRCDVVGQDLYMLTDRATCVANRAWEWVPGATTGAPWQVLTSGFAHVEIWHIGFNMLALYYLGPPLERVLGRARFLAVYFIGLFAASAFVIWLSNPHMPTLGASGAVFGLLGAFLVIAWKNQGDVRTILLWLGLNVVFTAFGPSISWQGHLGGFIGGLLASLIIVFAPRENRTRVQTIGLAVLSAVTAAALVVPMLA